MPVEAACPSCDGKFRLPDAAAGKKIRCPKCKGPLDVPPLTADVPAAPEPTAPQVENLKTTWRTATQEPAPPEPARVETPRVTAPQQPAAVVQQPAQQPVKSTVVKSPVPSAPVETPKKSVAAPVPAPAPVAPKTPSAPKPAAAPTPAPAPVAVKPKPAETPAVTPTPAPDQWFLRGDDGETFGPVDRPTLNAWHDEGRMTADSQLLKQGTEQWQWASDLYPDLDEPAASTPATSVSTPASSAVDAEDSPPAKIRSAKAAAVHDQEETEDDADEAGLSPHSKPVAFLLALTLGMFGIHRFYLGYVGIGLAMFFTFGGLLMWSITDALRILFGQVPDSEGLKLRD